MTREEVISKIEELFYAKYGIKLTDYPEDTDVHKFAEINEKLDSIEFMNFIFDVEDMFDVKEARARRILNELVVKGLIEKHGKARSTIYKKKNN